MSSAQDLVVQEAGLVFEPLTSLDSAQRVRALFRQLGYKLPAGKLRPGVSALVARAEETIDALIEFSEASDGAKVEALAALAQNIVKMTEEIAALEQAVSDAAQAVPEFAANAALDQLPKRLLDYLIITYTRSHRPEVHAVMRLAGVFDRSALPADEARFQPATSLRVIHWNRLPEIIVAPVELFDDVYQWNTNFDSETFFINVDRVLRAFLLPGGIYQQNPTLKSALGNTGDDLKELRFPILENADFPTTYSQFGVAVTALESHGPEKAGAAIVPYVYGTADFDFDVSDTMEIVFEAEASVDAGLGILLRPGDIEFMTNLFNAPSTAGTMELELAFRRQQSMGEIILLGAAERTRLAIEGPAARVFVDGEDQGSDVGIEVELDVVRLVVAGGEGDAFLNTILGDEGIRAEAGLVLGYSLQRGFYLSGQDKLELAIPTHIELGFGAIEELYLAIGPVDGDGGAGSLALEVAASAKITLGPVKGTIQRMGLEATLAFPEDGGGNLGFMDVGFGFRPPNGLGIAIETGPVSGGGFLAFYPEDHRYSGAFELQVAQYGLSVVGLLKTQLPGTDGYSLLVLITADLPPVQLGFGFVMTAIGGLGGIHRAFKTKPLARAIRSGNVSSVLFPKNVVENANQIFTDLRAIFPPRPDLYVFGPMIELGWGTPTIIRGQLGVLVAIPTWKIALVGKFLVDLPDEKAALIDLNLAVLGVLDIPNQRLSIDASLYDSRIVRWSLSGDMAMRLRWGDNARFVLSVGGWHPQFTVPDNFPELDRVRASLAVPGGNPSLELTGYLAVTPNTFQVGAGVALRAEAGPAQVKGDLSFDALFRFNPFTFVVDFDARLTFSLKGKTLGIKVDGTLKGPQPYHVKGKVHIEIFLFEATIHVNVTIGPSGGTEELPPAKVLPMLIDELEKPQNWVAQAPENGSQLVTLRDRGESEQQRVLVHPLGRIGVRQQIVPLTVEIEKYGNAKPQHTHFEIAKMKVALSGSDGNLADRTLREQFAPARFREMTDDEKLQSQAFEKLPAGRMMADIGVSYNDGQSKKATLAYEVSVIDRKNEQPRTTDPTWETGIPANIGQELVKRGAVATGKLRTTGSARYRNPNPSMNVMVSDQHYVMVWSDTLKRVAVDGNPAEGRTRVEMQDRARRWRRNHPQQSDAVRIVGRSEVAS